MIQAILSIGPSHGSVRCAFLEFEILEASKHSCSFENRSGDDNPILILVRVSGVRAIYGPDVSLLCGRISPQRYTAKSTDWSLCPRSRVLEFYHRALFEYLRSPLYQSGVLSLRGRHMYLASSGEKSLESSGSSSSQWSGYCNKRDSVGSGCD